MHGRADGRSICHEFLLYHNFSCLSGMHTSPRFCAVSKVLSCYHGRQQQQPPTPATVDANDDVLDRDEAVFVVRNFITLQSCPFVSDNKTKSYWSFFSSFSLAVLLEFFFRLITQNDYNNGVCSPEGRWWPYWVEL